MLKLGDEYIDVSKVSYIGVIDRDDIRSGFVCVVDGVEMSLLYGGTLLDNVKTARDLLIEKCSTDEFVADEK